MTQYIHIPLAYADAVIGISGATISYTRRTSGANISAQETRGVPGEMTIEINGSPPQVQTARNMIEVHTLTTYFINYTQSFSIIILTILKNVLIYDSICWQILCHLHHSRLLHSMHNPLRCLLYKVIAKILLCIHQPIPECLLHLLQLIIILHMGIIMDIKSPFTKWVLYILSYFTSKSLNLCNYAYYAP